MWNLKEESIGDDYGKRSVNNFDMGGYNLVFLIINYKNGFG